MNGKHPEPCQEPRASSKVLPEAGGEEKSPHGDSHFPISPHNCSGFPRYRKQLPSLLMTQVIQHLQPITFRVYFLQLRLPVEQASRGNLPWPEPKSRAAQRGCCHAAAVPPPTTAAGHQALHSIRSCGQRAGKHRDATLAAPEVIPQQPIPIGSHHFPAQVPSFAFWPSTFPRSHHFALLLVCLSSPSILSAGGDDSIKSCFSVSFQSHSRAALFNAPGFRAGRQREQPCCLPPAATALPG